MSPAAKGPAGPASLPVGRGWHGRPYYVSRPAPCIPRTEGAGRGRVLEATSWATLWRRAQLRSACPSHGDTPLPCVALASQAHLISLGKGSDSA